jgi:hypothetical protein
LLDLTNATHKQKKSAPKAPTSSNKEDPATKATFNLAAPKHTATINFAKE